MSLEVKKSKRVVLEGYAEAIFESLDEDGSGEVSKTELLDFIEKLGPSRHELAAEVEMLFEYYDDDGRGFLELNEFRMLLHDLDLVGSAGAVRRKLMQSPVYWCSCLVVLASVCALLSGTLTALMGGKKNFTKDNGVFDFAVTRTAWKFMDYPKAIFLFVRAVVLFLHQMRFFSNDAFRLNAIHDALMASGEDYIRQKKRAAELGYGVLRINMSCGNAELVEAYCGHASPAQEYWFLVRDL